MKKIAIMGLLFVASTLGVPKLAEALGYPAFSIQDNMQTLQATLESVTKSLQH